jgi:hypothetical protein
MLRAARAARRAGVSSLRLNLRGADRSGEDFYHAGLIEDLDATLRSPELARYEQIVILGFSLGGHVTLRYAAIAPDPRVRAVASVCAPLELARSTAAFDRPERWLYRRHVLAGLKEMYAEVAKRRSVPLLPERAARISTILEWDDRTVAPRHGFGSAAAYYDAVSVGPRLREVKRPALVVAARHDPMVPESTVRSSLDRARDAVDVRWIDRGGHVGFPSDADLGVSKAGRGLEPQVIGWLLDQP